MNYDNILIITYGRSGSTLLQGVVNALPGVQVMGENSDFVFSLFQAYKGMEEARNLGHWEADNNRKHTGDQETLPADPWYGGELLDLDSFKSTIVELVDQQIRRGALVGGFKEIRYVNKTRAELFDYLDFLPELFPNPLYIFNTRNLDDVCRSGWWNEGNKPELERTEKNFRRYAEQHPDVSFIQSHEDTIGERIELRALFEKLGVSYDEDRVASIIAKPHSYNKPHRTSTNRGSQSIDIAEDVAMATLWKWDFDEEECQHVIEGLLCGKNWLQPDELEVDVAEGEVVSAHFGMASPGVKEANPDLMGAGYARFKVVVDANRNCDIRFSRAGELLVHLQRS